MTADAKPFTHIDPHPDGQGVTVLVAVGEARYVIDATTEIATVRGVRCGEYGLRRGEAHVDLGDYDDGELAEVIPFPTRPAAAPIDRVPFPAADDPVVMTATHCRVPCLPPEPEAA